LSRQILIRLGDTEKEGMVKGITYIREEKELVKVAVPWGDMTLVCDTEEFSVSVTSLSPGKRLPAYYYKKGMELIYILKGEGEGAKGRVREGDLLRVSALETYWIANSSSQDPLRFLVICIPPYTQDDCVWVGEET